MKKRYVAGQIGCGAFAMEQHGPNLLRNPNIAGIKWACDVNVGNAKRYADQFSAAQTTASFEDITTDPEVDVICIATSHEIHAPIIESAARHGKHIFCEKPMAMTEEQAYRIIKAVRTNGVKLCVDYMRRTAPALVALKREWLKHKSHPRHQPWRYIEKPREKLIEEKATDFLVRVQDESASYRMVHLDPFSGGGLIIGEAVHWLDLACWLFGDDRPVTVRAWGSARMRYGIHVAFQSGNEATILMTPNGTFDYPKEVYEIACDGALFRNEFYVENQYYGRPGIENETFPLQRDGNRDVGLQGGLSGYLEKHKARARPSENTKQGWGDLLADHGYEHIFDGFMDAILTNGPTPCDELAGFRATYLGELAMKSIELDKPLPVPVEKWDYYVHLA
jgi:predicted dehydrogenase